MTDALTAEALYLRLGSLIADTPDLMANPTPPATHRWLGQVLALFEAGRLVGGPDIGAFRVASQHLDGPMRDMNAGTILAIAHQALARAELRAPAEVQGAFIPAGHAFDAFAAVGKALGTATADVFIIDPYADAKLLTDYAVLAPEKVSVRVMAEATYRKT